jgi:hypothetical protein
MIVVVPYGVTGIGALDETPRPPIEAVRMNLAIQGVRFREIRMLDDYSYAALVTELWADGEPFAIVEHDVLPWPGWLDSLANCSRPWCGFGYLGPGGRWLVETGCTRIDPAAAKLDGTALDVEPRPTWQHVDISVRDAFRREGIIQHEHRPGVVHLHRGYG